MALCPAACACHLPLGFGFLELVRLQVDSVRPGDLGAWSPSVSEPGGGWGVNNEAFSRGNGGAGRGKAICPCLRPRGLLQGEGLRGGGARPWQGLEGGWASRAPGNRGRLDARGVLGSVFRAWLCLLHLEAVGRGEMGRAGGEEHATGHLLASGLPTAAQVPQKVRAGTALPAHLVGGRGAPR